MIITCLAGWLPIVSPFPGGENAISGRSELNCGSTTVKRYLVVEPVVKYALTCADDAPLYTVKMMLDTTGGRQRWIRLTLILTARLPLKSNPNSQYACRAEGSNNCLSFAGNNQAEASAVNGVLELKVKPLGIGEVVLEASIFSSG